MRVRLAFILALGLSAGLADRAQAGDRTDSRQILPREAHLACGVSYVSLLSGFRVESIKANELQAVFQVLTVMNASGHAKSFFMQYQPHKYEDNSMVVSMDCLRNLRSKRLAVALNSTNFGSCRNCEWTDLFSEDGEVLSLAKTPFGAVNIDRRRFNRKGMSGYLDAQGQVVASIQISRAIQERQAP